jgi:hypothetical protein
MPQALVGRAQVDYRPVYVIIGRQSAGAVEYIKKQSTKSLVVFIYKITRSTE